jgi:hypothetical protein
MMAAGLAHFIQIIGAQATLRRGRALKSGIIAQKLFLELIHPCGRK